MYEKYLFHNECSRGLDRYILDKFVYDHLSPSPGPEEKPWLEHDNYFHFMVNTVELLFIDRRFHFHTVQSPSIQ